VTRSDAVPSLEGCAERVHQHHVRDEATANIAQELRDNRKQLHAANLALESERTNLIGVLAFIAARQANKPYDISKLALGFSIVPLHEASWNTAATTGALSFIDYTRVQDFAAAYKLQDQYSHLQDEALEEFIEMQSYVVTGQDPMTLPVADLLAGEPTVRRALAHMKAMQDIAASLAKDYDDALKFEEEH
jgi:hypothetical protein